MAAVLLMNILYIAPEVPWPLTSGYLRHYHFMKALGTRHVVKCFSLSKDLEPASDAVAALKPFVKELRVFSVHPRADRMALAAGVLGDGVGRELRWRLAVSRMKTALRQELAEGDIDLIFCGAKPCLSLLDDTVHLPLVVDCCDTSYVRLRAELSYAPLARKAVLYYRYHEQRRLERSMPKRTPYVLFGSRRDQLILTDGARFGHVVPQGVDAEYWKRTRPAGPGCIIFTGVMEYPPNHDAAMLLLSDILPRVRQSIPDVELLIVGRDPLPKLVQAASPVRGAYVTGAVADMRPYLERATVFAAPLRFASGVQNKLLEALAMELPVLTTECAAAGIRVGSENLPLIIAGDPAESASAIVRLLRDDSLRRDMGKAGRDYVERYFRWADILDDLVTVCAAAVQEQSRKQAA